MKLSVTPADMLKLANFPSLVLHSMNSIISGWSTRRMAILAPRRVPPCLTVSVALLNTCMKDTGPEAVPAVERTLLFLGRRRENENPVPPPLL